MTVSFEQTLRSGQQTDCSTQASQIMTTSVLGARWIGLSIEQAERLLLCTAPISILSFEHDCQDEPAIALWNEASAKQRNPQEIEG